MKKTIDKIIFKPLDIVKTPSGAIAMVNEVYINDNGYQNVSIAYFDYVKKPIEKSAWWSNEKFGNTKEFLDDLIILDSIPRLLANGCAHNMGSHTNQGSIYFPLDRTTEVE